MSYKEVAAFLDVPESTVLGRLQVARERLRDALMLLVEETIKAERPTSELTQKVMAALPVAGFMPPIPQGAGLLGFLKGTAVWKVSGLLGAATLGTALYFSGIAAVIQHGRGTGSIKEPSGMILELDGTRLRQSADRNEAAGESPAVLVSAQQVRGPRNVEGSAAMPKLGVTGETTDSVVAITYTVPESAHVELSVADASGDFVAQPVNQPRPAGTYTVRLDKSRFVQGTYFVILTLDHDRGKQARRLFRHSVPERDVTKPKQAQELLNRAIVGTALDPQDAVQDFERLLNEYPDFIDKGSVYLRSLPAHCMASDSAIVIARADSAAAWNPRSHIYAQIAGILGGTATPDTRKPVRYLSAAIHYAKQAIEHVEDSPESLREERRFRYLETLGQLHALAGDDSRAETVFKQAVSAFENLPPHSRFVKGAEDLRVLETLGNLHQKQGDFDSAIAYYTQGLQREPLHSDLWRELRRTYVQKHGSDEGYDRFREALERQLPQITSRPENATVPTFPFPDFTLSTLDGREIRLADLRGKVVVVNFWAFWCSPCMEELPMLERLYQAYEDHPVEIIGVHSRAGMGAVSGEEGDSSLAKKVMARYPTSYPQVFDTREMNLMKGKLEIQAIPTTFILDKQGVVRYRELGYDPHHSYERFMQEIQRLLAEE